MFKKRQKQEENTTEGMSAVEIDRQTLNQEPKQKESFLVENLKEKDIEDYEWLLPRQDMTIDDFMQERISSAFMVALGYIILMAVAYIVALQFLGFIIDPITLLLGLLGTVVLVFKYPYLRLKSKLKKASNNVYQDFPLWISSLEVLIVTNNIPNTLKKSLATCPISFKKDLEILVKQIEEKPTEKRYYQNFLSKYQLNDVHEIIMDIYQFNFLNKDEIIVQFENVHKKLNKIAEKNRQARFNTEITLLGMLNCIPIFSLCIYILMVAMLLSNMISG